MAVAAGENGVIVTPRAPQRYSVTVAAFDLNPSGSIVLTDGRSGPILAIVPTNFPGSDIHLSSPKFFGRSVFATPNGQAPAQMRAAAFSAAVENARRTLNYLVNRQHAKLVIEPDSVDEEPS